MDENLSTIWTAGISALGSFLAAWLVFRNKSREVLDRSFEAHLNRLDEQVKELSEALEKTRADLVDVKTKLKMSQTIQNELLKLFKSVKPKFKQIAHYLGEDPPKIHEARHEANAGNAIIESFTVLMEPE